MMRERSAVGLLFHTLITGAWVVLLILLAFVWSLGQTIELTQEALMDPYWGVIMGLVIQLGPQVFLALASVSIGNQRMMWLGAFWAFSAVDALTNIGALWNGYDIDVIGLVPIIVGMIVAVGIVFAEEVIAFGLSILSDDIAKLWEAWGGTAPQWLFITGDALSRVGAQQMFGGQTAGGQRSRQRKQASA